jgi:glycosyltransferase involved in cell wall biosynthesis
MRGRVFIGLPTYNRPEGLRTALTHLTEQTWNDITILVSDNASPNPAVQDVIADFARRDGRIRSMRQLENIGPANNFRAVLTACDAPYFMWASDDDVWEPDFVASAMDLLEANPQAQMAFCTIDNINLGGTHIRSYAGFSRFCSTADRAADSACYLREPEVLGKANLIYGLFRTEPVRAAAEDFWDVADFDAWGGDMVFMFGFIARHQVVASDRVLLHKRMPVSSDAPIQISDPSAIFIPLEQFASYLERHKAAAPNADIAALAASILRKRRRQYLWRRIKKLPRRLAGASRRLAGA